MNPELAVRNARLRSGKICDISVKDGLIETIGKVKDLPREIDAKGRLVTETFVVPHLHLDKVLTGSMAEESALSKYHGSAMTEPMKAIELASKVKEHYVEHEILERVRKVLDNAEGYGVSHLRAFADVDTKAKLTGITALLKAKEEFKNRIEVQIVAFPQEGIIKEPGAEELLYRAMDLGADVVGGIPWIERTEEDSRKHVDVVFEIAKKYNADVAMLTDDAADPKLRTTEYLAASTIKNEWNGRVTACHARATALYDEIHHEKLAALLKQAGVGVVTNPHTGPLHVRVQELLRSGVTVALSQDDVFDAYYPYGRCNMLEVAFLASHLLWMMSEQDREVLFDMITLNAAKVMRLNGYGLAPGNTANLLILNARDLREALASHSEPLCVVRNGVVRQETSLE